MMELLSFFNTIEGYAFDQMILLSLGFQATKGQYFCQINIAIGLSSSSFSGAVNHPILTGTSYKRPGARRCQN
jgi:hypothetical protein